MTAPPLHYAPTKPAPPAQRVIHLAPGTSNPSSRSHRSSVTPQGSHGADLRGGYHLRSWPLLILALPAAVAVWSGWVGIGQMTGFGKVHPLPGLWPALHLNTAITLPVGVEAYAAYALRAWLAVSATISTRTRRFARRSAIGSLLPGMAGQIAYHLLAQARTTRVPWPITTAVACLPVLVLGTGAALTHLLHADTNRGLRPVRAAVPGPDQAQDHPIGAVPSKNQRAAGTRPGRLAQAEAAAQRISADGRRVSRRTLRAAGVRASNAELGTLAITLNQATTANGNQK